MAGLANNHALDFGPDALADTVAHLEGARIEPAGVERRGVLAAAGDLTLGVLAMSDHPAEYSSGIAFADLRRALPDWVRAELERLRAAADFVLAFPHWGPNMTAPGTVAAPPRRRADRRRRAPRRRSFGARLPRHRAVPGRARRLRPRRRPGRLRGRRRASQRPRAAGALAAGRKPAPRARGPQPGLLPHAAGDGRRRRLDRLTPRARAQELGTAVERTGEARFVVSG